MQSNSVLRSCGSGILLPGIANDQSWKAWIGVLSLPDVSVLFLESSVCCGGTVYGRVEGIRLYDRFRIALEEKCGACMEGIAMRGRLSRIKRNGRKVQC